MTPTTHRPTSRLKRFFTILGPGLVTGAADDDPSGIATYSIAGAQFGTGMLWMSWFSWPLMTAVQAMCARVGIVTGQGLASVLKQKLPAPVLMLCCLALFAANTINIGADLAGMADAAQLLTGVSAYVYVVCFGAFIAFAVVRFQYQCIASVLKWLAFTLFAYIATAFILRPDWSQVARDSFSFAIPKDSDAWQMVVAILGTTISPYLFFWQASQEVEEEKAKGRIARVQREGATREEIFDSIIDVSSGTLLSNTVMFFIILTTALTLHANGMTDISSSKEAAEALRPLAGNLAMLLYSVGIITVGALAIPTLAGSSAYAFAEAFNWPHGLDAKLNQAKAFYAVILCAILCGVGMDFMHINPMQALLWSAVINGLLAPFLLVVLLVVARDKAIMKGQPSPLISQAIVAITTVLMFLAAAGMFWFSS